ncbi:MAG: SAM-dependent methyltransferase [Clostridiaceae bacterium]
MNKQSISKLKLFFMGLNNRYLENNDIFLKIKVVYKTGLKEFKGEGTFDNEKIKYNYNGITKSYEFNDLLEAIVDQCEKYETVTITYSERGTNVLINGDNKNVTMKNVETKEEDNNTLIKKEKSSTLLNRNYYIKADKAEKLLKAIDIMTKDGKIKNDKIRKYNQIDHYVELLDSLLDKFKNKGIITILDCGCGKSYLSFVLNYYLTEVKKIKCNFIGIDYSEQVIEASKNIASELGYRNMEFLAMDIKNFKPKKKINIVLSLHACDTATDMALALGVRVEADAIIAVPCCHREILSQYSYKPFESVLKYGILKARMADVLTDGLRGTLLEAKGYDVSIIEYISPLETPKNLMIKAFKVKDEDYDAMNEYINMMASLNVYPAFYNYLNNWE